MGQEKPLVSIIVRTKDRPGLLRHALKSIAAQTYRPLEVVLVNDGGCALDSVGLQAVLGNIPLNYISLEKNAGRANAGNIGIESATGTYIAFLDDDDEYYPEHIASLQRFIHGENADLCYSDCEIRQAEYNKVTDTLQDISTEPFLSYDFDYSFLLFTNYIPVICTLFRKEVFDRIGRFDTSFELYEDWDLLIRAGETCSVRHLKGISAIYNKWDPVSQITGSVTSGDYAKDRLYYTRIIDKHRAKYTGDALYSSYVIYNHLSLKYTSTQTLNTFLEREYKKIEAEKSRLDSENAGLWQENSGLLEEKSRFEAEISRLSGNNLRLGEENLRLVKLLRDQEERIRTLEEGTAALSSRLARILSSRGWRLLTKYYNAKEFITGTDLKPDLFERTRDILKRTAKKALPKKFQIYIRLLLYHLSSRQNGDKLLAGTQGGRPFISIIIPVYNRSAFLKQALETALDQDYDTYEVVAVDDCSTEQETREILTEFSSRHSKLRVFFNDKNSGISETMNSAIIHAKGDYIAFLDCDDFLPREALSKTAAAILQNPDKGYYFSDRINVDIHAKEIERITFANRRRDNYLRELMKGMFTDHLKIIRKAAFLDAGFHDKIFDAVQDYEFALRYAFKYPAGFGYINDYLYFHRVYPEQLSTKKAGHQKKLADDARDISRFRVSIREGKAGKKISIVILSFNKKEHTLKCVESIKTTVHGDYEIIIFDNKSSVDTVELLTRTFSDDKKVKLFFSEENLGCPGGRKKALSYARGDYMVTLDNDIIVTSGWIENLILRVEEGSDIAGACCKVIFPDNKIQYNGGKAVINNGFVEFTLIDAWKDMNEMTTMRRYDCDWIPGGATIYKSRIYEKISICDEFRNAYEDNDFSFNVRKLGYRLVNCPTARVIHNHVMYDRKSALHEKDYMASRYSHEALKQSVLAFYKRHGYIIKDEYVYRVFGFNGLDENEIRQKFIELAKG